MKPVPSYLLADPQDCQPPHGLDLRSNYDADQVAILKAQFLSSGWGSYPALIGYRLGAHIQLANGARHHLAAQQAGIKIPVALWLHEDLYHDTIEPQQGEPS